jgi:hypothetical protein
MTGEGEERLVPAGEQIGKVRGVSNVNIKTLSKPVGVQTRGDLLKLIGAPRSGRTEVQRNQAD